MNPIDPHESPVAPSGEPPSKDQLLRTVAIAGIVAAVALLLFVLPAEYGLDPTGFGTAIGLVEDDAPAAVGSAHNLQDGAPMMQSWKFDLPADGRWFEHKLAFEEGMTIFYSWNATVEVRADFHHDEFGSFDDQVATQVEASFTAPADGLYGWAFRNPEGGAVTIELLVQGYWQT